MVITKINILFFLIGLNISLLYLYFNIDHTVLIRSDYIDKECRNFFNSNNNKN